MLSKKKVYFKKEYDAWGMFWENKEEWLKLRLAWKPKFLLKAIYEDEVKKNWWDILSKALAEDVALKKYKEVLHYLEMVEKHSPFVLYFTK